MQSQSLKRTPRSSADLFLGKEILIKVVVDADVGLKKRDAAPNEPTSITIDADGSIIIGKRDIEDDINVNLGSGVGVTSVMYLQNTWLVLVLELMDRFTLESEWPPHPLMMGSSVLALGWT